MYLSLGLAGSSRQVGRGCRGCSNRFSSSVCSPRAGVGVREFRAQRLFSSSWWFVKGEQHLIHLPFFVLNMAFDRNVTKNLFWYNSKPHSCVWNFTFPASRPSVLHFVRDHSGHWISDSPWLLSPLLVAAFWSPDLSPGGHRYLLTSHTSGRGWH